MNRKKIIFRVYFGVLCFFIFFCIYSFNKFFNFDYDINECLDSTYYVYLINNDNLLVSSNILVSDDINNRVFNIIDSLKIDSFHDGLYGVLDSRVKINSFSIIDSILFIDFNDFLFAYGDRDTVLSSLVFSLCQNGISGISISVNGNDNIFLDRSFGINKVYDFNRFNDIKKVIVYNKSDFILPVTRYLNSDMDKIDIIISLLNYDFERDRVSCSDDICLVSLDGLDNYDDVVFSLGYSFIDSECCDKVVFTINDEIFTIKVK